MNKSLILLAIQRVRELGTEALQSHSECLKFHSSALTPIQITNLSLAHHKALQKQDEWLRAILSEFEEDA